MDTLPSSLKQKIYDMSRSPALLCVSKEFSNFYKERRKLEKRIFDSYGARIALYTLKDHEEEYEKQSYTCFEATNFYTKRRHLCDLYKEIAQTQSSHNIIEHYKLSLDMGLTDYLRRYILSYSSSTVLNDFLNYLLLDSENNCDRILEIVMSSKKYVLDFCFSPKYKTLRKKNTKWYSCNYNKMKQFEGNIIEELTSYLQKIQKSGESDRYQIKEDHIQFLNMILSPEDFESIEKMLL